MLGEVHHNTGGVWVRIEHGLSGAPPVVHSLVFGVTTEFVP
jgi:hypothetical protein